MALYSRHNTLEANLDILASVDYPGRLLVVGRATTRLAMQVYAIGGRSDGSKNRVLINEDNIVGTAAFDTTKSVGNPKLTIYDAMRRAGDRHFVTNGNQTGTAIQFARCGRSFRQAMNSRWFEPDKPNFTPRISGYSDANPAEGEPGFGLSIIRRIPSLGTPLRIFYMGGEPGLEVEPGVGYCLHTYSGDDDPLPSFNEAPFSVPLLSTAADTAELFWDNLDPRTRVAVAAKTIDASGVVDISIINLHKK